MSLDDIQSFPHSAITMLISDRDVRWCQVKLRAPSGPLSLHIRVVFTPKMNIFV